MSISKYNQNTFDVDFDKLTWKKLEDLYEESDSDDKIYTITGLFVKNDAKFGPRAFAATPDNLVGFPAHRLDDVKKMLEDTEVIEQINAGNAGFKIREYTSRTYERECYDVYFVDIF